MAPSQPSLISGTPTAVLVTPPGGHPHRSVTTLLYGRFRRTTRDPRGTLHWVSPGEVVIYAVRDRTTRTFVFRTACGRPDAFRTRVLGVSPSVTLLAHARSLTRQALLLRLFRNLLRDGRDPSTLTDLFFAKVHAVLARRGPSFDALETLLLQHDADACSALAPSTGGMGRREG